MCEKCRKVLADPKALIGLKNLDNLTPFINAALPLASHSQERMMEVGINAGQPIHPATTAAILGWLYYATMMHSVLEGDFTEEEFVAFNTMLFKDVKEGMHRTTKTTSVRVVSFDELPDEVKALVRNIEGETRH